MLSTGFKPEAAGWMAQENTVSNGFINANLLTYRIAGLFKVV